MKYVGMSFVIASFFYLLLIASEVHEIKKCVLKCEIMLLKNEVKQ